MIDTGQERYIFILYMRRSCASLRPRHTVHPVHKKRRSAYTERQGHGNTLKSVCLTDDLIIYQSLVLQQIQDRLQDRILRYLRRCIHLLH